MIAYQDHYSVLEVKSCATFQEIKKAYHKMALRYHPDKNKGGEEQFKKVDWAYRVLKDPQKRTEFDQIYKQNKKRKSFQKKSKSPTRKNPPKSSHDDSFRPNSSNTYNNYQNESEKPKWKNPPKSSHDDGFGPNYSYTYNTYHKESEKPKEPPKLKMALIIGGSMVFAYLTYKMIQNRRAASAAEMVMVAISKDNIVEPLEAASATIEGISKIGKWTTGSPNAHSSSTFAISAAISKVGSAFAKGISNIWKWTTRSPKADSSTSSVLSAIGAVVSSTARLVFELLYAVTRYAKIVIPIVVKLSLRTFVLLAKVSVALFWLLVWSTRTLINIALTIVEFIVKLLRNFIGT